MTDSSTSKIFWSVAAGGAAAAIGFVMVKKSRGSSTTSTETKKKKKIADETWESHVKPDHGPLEEIRPGVLYRVEAPGCEYGPPTRNMVIYRPPSSFVDEQKRLVIVNAIAVREDLLEEILTLGEPHICVVPNHMHKCCAGVWQRRFPKMKVVCVGGNCPANSRSLVEEIVDVDMTTAELADQAEWKDYITVKQIDGWGHFEDVIEVRLDKSNNKKAIILADLLFTVPYDKDAGIFGRAIQWLFDSYVEQPSCDNDSDEKQLMIPKVSRVARMFGIRDWKKAEAWYRNYAKDYGNDIFAILVGHGPPVVELDSKQGCTQALEGVADQLVKPRW